MNILYIFPPQWVPICPHFALPSLMGQFKDSKYNVSAMDLNLDFYLEILEKKHLENCLKNGHKLKEQLEKEIPLFYERTKDYNTYSLEQKNKLGKYVMIKSFFDQFGKDCAKFPVLVSGAIDILKSKTHFYNPKLLFQALDIIDKSLKIASLEYFPATLSFSSYYNQNFEYTMEDFIYYVNDKSTNMYVDFFEKKLEETKKKNPDYIGISINSSSQIVAGLTLSKMLKENTNAHICIGGNYFGRVVESIEKRPEFFEIFADSICVQEGERPVLELAEYIAGKRKIEDVSNLVYLKDGKVKANPIKEPMCLDDMKPMNFNGFDLKKYLLPEIIMPFQTSRGCYWKKCSFCDHDFGLKYNIKSLDSLVEQIKFMKKEYGINKFEFIDEAISPSYLDEMSQRFIDEDLNVSFFCDARLESGFTTEILEKAKKAGLQMVLWGLESGSRKIMDLINKGVDFDDRMNVLKRASDADIFNFAFIFFGFPAETKEDALETIELIRKNSDIIHTYGRSVFTLGKHTKIRENPEKYGVIGEIKQEAEFSPTYIYKAAGMNQNELNEIFDLCTKMAVETYGNNLVFKLLSRELIFLYLSNWGIDRVKEYRF